MKKAIIPLLLCFVLMLGLFPAQAFAEGGEQTEGSAETVETVGCPAESEPVTNPEGSVLTNTAEGVVYNDGGTVFNNGGVVFNNSGTVYNNNGTVYNNEGTVYTNMGTVYNNGGTVYNNGGTVIENGVSEDVPEENVEADVTVEELPTEEPAEEVEEEAAEESVETEEMPAEEPAEEAQEVAAPGFGLDEGIYDGAQILELSADENCRIFYTLDGNDPDSTSSEYTQPIEISESVCVKAFAVAEDGSASRLAVRNYGILEISIPRFAEVQPGYAMPDAADILVENKGSTDITVKNLLLEGENADSFYLNRSAGYKVKAGTDSGNFWTVHPIAFLEAGEYKAVLRFVFSDDKVIEKEISFVVRAPSA